MNVVIFGKGFGKHVQVNLSGKSAAALAVVAAAFVGSLTFGAGYWLSAHNGSGVSIAEVAQLTSALDDQRSEIADTRQQAEDTLDALAIRIGQMNAR